MRVRERCAPGELKVTLAGGQTRAETALAARQAGALAEDMRDFLTEHRTLWLARNRVAGSKKAAARARER